MIKVMIVEDSKTVQLLLRHIISLNSSMEVAAVYENGRDAVENIDKIRPDIILMDINMPVMDGLEATKIIMSQNPLPIIIVSATWDAKESYKSFKALEYGALTGIAKPTGLSDINFEKNSKELLKLIKLMAEIKPVRRAHNKAKEILEIKAFKKAGNPRVVAIGASTGGPIAIKKVLDEVPKNFFAPILIVQHIMKEFLDGLGKWLSETSHLSIKVAKNNELTRPGIVYLAPGGCHMLIDEGGRINLMDYPERNFAKPSVSYLFESVAESYKNEAIGIVLTGMGKDGAKELKKMKDYGAITMAQSQESSVIFGMPKEAIDINAANHILSAENIGKMLFKINQNIIGN